MRILESQRHKILDQLEKCPSSGDETETPRKRAKYSQELVTDDAHNNHHNNHDPSATNCNGKVLDHRDASSASFSQNHHRYHHTDLVHRKTVEIRRLSDCNIKHSASVPGGAMTSSVNYTKPNRRPSTDSLSRYQTMDSYQLMMHKRRKTSATASTSSSSSTMTLIDNDQQLVTKCRANPLNVTNSFEASGGESEHGSRPGTPLFDERPENSIDPRRPPIAGRSAEPMNLPLPKFTQQFHQQLRQNNQLLPAAHATAPAEKHDTNNGTAMLLQHSSLTNRSISPTPQTSQVRSRSNSLMPPVSSGSSNSETALTSPRPPSLVSNSSDSEHELGSIPGPNASPSLEERLKKFTEDYDSWSSNGRSSSSSHYMNNFRHAVPEIAVPETPELLKNVLKNSMFDEDSKRLENIDKLQASSSALPTATVTSKNAFGTFCGSHLSLSGNLSPMLSMMNSIPSLGMVPTYTEIPTATSALSNSLGKLHMPTQQPVTITTMIHQRLGSSGTGSPLNSPNTTSPYNSPNPSSASSISSIKGLQYPFPTHPTLSTTSTTSTTSTSSASLPLSNVVASTSSAAPSLTIVTMVASSNCPKPKTSCALGKSVSLQEVSATNMSTSSPSSSTSSTTGNNNNSNNFNSSCNKSSTNNNNVNNSNGEHLPSKLLMKSASLPNCGTSITPPCEPSSLEKVDEKKNLSISAVARVEDVKQQEVTVKKEFDSNERKIHSKDRRKNSEIDEATVSKDEAKEHAKKDKDSSFRKEKEKKSRETETEKKVDEKKSKSHKKSKDDHHHQHSVEEKKDEIVERAPSPLRKRRVSFEDVSSVDSSSEQTIHIDKSSDKCSKDSKHHDGSKSNSKHHHHHNHKEKKGSSKEKTHCDDENHAKSRHNDIASSKDSIFDELKRNSKDNIIKTSDKVHKSKKHHHHYHRENSTKDKENQTQVNNFNDTSSSVMTEDIRSSEDEVMRHHNHSQKKDFSDNEKRSNHEYQKSRPESSEESSGKKKYPRRSMNNSLSTDDSDDSENGKTKTSFFDIPDEAPNISMYDKVKARSCKNLKKQEDEKKIKDKFSALKQSRAKRERKRLNTSDDDTDSDMDSSDMFQLKFRKSQLSGSGEGEVDKDSENEMLRKAKIRNHLSVCDDESSESGITINDGHRKRNKFSSRKMSRTNVIDSSDDEMPTTNDNENKHVEIKQEPNDFPSMPTSDFDDLKKNDEAHSESRNFNNKHGSNGTKKRHHDKHKDDKSSKKSKKLSRDLHRKSTSSIDNNHKREDKMDDIFGSISDEEIIADTKNNFTSAMIEIKQEVCDIKPEPSEIISKEQQREESRKRKEKRRREREKQRAIKVEENSVDLDEAGRALEAQLMSDNEQKSNHKEPNKDVKSDDVFRFTDGDDEMKRDHHDSIKKKKKKKRAKEERKHHHNHHHYDNLIKEEGVANSLETSGAFNNNNNTKIPPDVIINDVKPSLPLLMDDAPPKIVPAEVVIPAAPIKKENKKADVVIPGFGKAVDEAVHQKAVQSIEKELEKKPEKKVEAEKSPEPVTLDNKAIKAEGEKIDEKSRVVISQEETEDAVAALLGESFSMAVEDDYNDPYDVPIVANENEASDSAVIPPEEDEEMKNAIMSLNPDMDTKPETPQSEHDLQIDTDNDDAGDEEEASNQPFDNPPKTPDVDMAQMEKEKKEPTPEREVAKPSQEVKAEKKSEQVLAAESKVETPKRTPSPKKEEAKVVALTEKKETPALRSVAPSLLSRLQPPTITIPQEQPSSIERVSPRAIKLASPGLKSTAAKTIETSNNVLNRVLPSVSAQSQKTVPQIIPSSPLPKPASPKIIAIPAKVEIKPILIHPPITPVKVNVLPHIGSLKPTNLLPYQPSPHKEQKSNTMTPAEKKNNLTLPSKPAMTAAQQQIMLQQAVSRQPQIIYPPTTSGMIQTNFVKAEVKVEVKVEAKETKPEQWQQNVNSVIQKIDILKEEPKVEKKPEVELSHEEDDYEESSPDNSLEREGTKKVRGTGRSQRGRKVGNVQSPSTSEDCATASTRRGGKTTAGSKRGRGGRAANAKNIIPPQIAVQTMMQSPAPPAGNVLLRQLKATGSDVYEFNDDSGEELAKGGDAARPRLLMTIKSSAVATTVNSHPVITSPSPVSISTTVQTTPITAPVIQPTVVQQAAIETLADAQLMISASPTSQQIASPAHSDDFAQPNNTRKSRRLQEKDGTRTSVDDTIDDVIRNIAPPNQNQHANSKRATRQHVVSGQPNAAGSASIPPHQHQALVNALNEVKKPVKSTKKQKDRKVSETSESETEKKPESIPSAIIATLQKPVIQEAHHQMPQLQSPQPQAPPIQVSLHQQQPQQIPLAQIQKHPDILLPSKPQLRESSELLQLIDPVTGELQKMTQSKEGQYVPVSEHHRLNAAKQLNLPATSVQQALVVEVKTEDKKVLTQPNVQNIVKVSSPVVIEPIKPTAAPTAELTHMIKPVITQNPTYSKPPTLKTYVLSSQPIAKSQVVTTAAQTPPTTVISSQGMMKINAPIVQHPSTIYNLPNIIPTNAGKYVPQTPPAQKTIVMPAHQSQPTIIHQNPQQQTHQQGPQIVHQKVPSNGQQPQIVIHSQQHPLMHQQQPTNNLMINIPTSSASGQSVSSPRMHVTKQVIQRTLPSQATPPQIPSTTVVMKAGQPHHVITASQDPKSQPTYIQQGTKIVQSQTESAPMSYINSGAREIIYVGGNVQKQTIYPNYPPTKYGPMPSPTLTKPQQIVQQIPSQIQQQLKTVEKASTQPSVSVTHIQMPHPHQQQPQQKVYFTNSGQVITNVPPTAGHQGPDNERHQQWITHEKIPTQPGQSKPMKSRFIMDNYEEAHRAQAHVERAQHQAAQSQGQVKRSYVIEAPGQHQLSSPTQPILHVPSSVVNQPIIPPQNKTVIGLNQAPQILTGAVASPPLKAHLTSQQPIVTGKLLCRNQTLTKDLTKSVHVLGASSSRVAIPPSSPKDQLHPRHYPPEGYEDAVMVSYHFPCTFYINSVI